MDELLFTSASVLDLLSNIDELKDKNIDVSEINSGIVITIGESQYNVESSEAAVIEVEPEVIDEIDEVTSEAYDELENSGVEINQSDVEGGPIKSLFKTLAVGGLVRMTAKLLQNK